MGVIDYSNIDRVRKVMRLIARQFSRIDCRITNRDSRDIYHTGEAMTYYSLELNKKLWQLHQMAMKELQSYSVETYGSANFFDEQAADEATINMVRNYASEHAFRRRQPMIELGYGSRTPQERQFTFFSQKIALWKIGYRGRLTKEMYFTRM